MINEDVDDILAKITVGSIPILVPCSRFWASVIDGRGVDKSEAYLWEEILPRWDV